MLFNSLPFIILVSLTFLVYYLPGLLKHQVFILIVASLFFYAYNVPLLLLLLLSSASINIITSYYVTFGNPGYRKILAVSGIVANISILAFFKYGPLFSRTFFSLHSGVGEFLLTIPLPIGISFYTFEGISLLTDVFRNKVYRQSNYNESDSTDIVTGSLREHAKRTLLFISFFPHLIAGPILKAHDFLPQIKTKYLKDIQWEASFKNIILGYFLKMVVADNLKDFTFWMAYPYFMRNSTINLISMLFGYSCQIFADFAGYSLIAIGIARLFGYNLQTNFNFPYISTSFREFWKRWHISLSTFLMEYLYIPLGGNRKGRLRTYLNLMLTMFLGGLWHGAAWSYAVWGTFHGLALALERMFTNKNKPFADKSILIKTFKRVGIFVFVTFAWLLFKLPHFTYAVKYLEAIIHPAKRYYDNGLCSGILIYSLPVFLYHAAYLLKEKEKYRMFKKLDFAFYAFLLFLIICNSGMAGTFIYFQF